jgi:hypothetical protein
MYIRSVHDPICSDSSNIGTDPVVETTADFHDLGRHAVATYLCRIARRRIRGAFGLPTPGAEG